MIKMPKVSICIPTLNRACYLQKAVESSISQTYTNIEIVISDNASIDNTLYMLSLFNDPRMVVLKHINTVSMQENWNECIRKADGEFFILLSDDDYLEVTAIEKMVTMFINDINPDSNPISRDEIGIVYCQTRVIDAQDTTIKLTSKAPKYETGIELIKGFFSCDREIFPCGIMLRTIDVHDIGGFNSDKYTMALDAGVWMTVILKRGYAAFIDQPLSNYRVHSSNVTSNVHIDEWLKGLDGLKGICEYYDDVDKKTFNYIEKAQAKYKVLVICELISKSGKFKTRFNVARQYIAYGKNFFIARMTYLLIKKILVTLLLPNYTAKKY